MTLPAPTIILQLLLRITEGDFFERVKAQIGWKENRCIYRFGVVLTLMILQRASGRKTLSRVVGLTAVVAGLERECERGLSSNTGGYSRARSRVPRRAVERAMEQMLEQLQQQDLAGQPGRGYILDGSSVLLAHEPGLIEAFPAGCNQHGTSHWPVLKLVVAHQLDNGLASAPAWGPMYGPRAVSEQALAAQVMSGLPAGSVILGDSNFGVFSVAYRAGQLGQRVLLRLTEARAKKLLGKLPPPGFEGPIQWMPSRADRRSLPGLPRHACLEGRLICRPLTYGAKTIRLYLFTTLGEVVAEELVKIYGERWNIELDIRSLKRSLNLHALTAKSVSMVEKELWVGVMTYNLVRTVMVQAAARANLLPRQLSFMRVLDLVEMGAFGLAMATTDQQRQEIYEQVLRSAAQCRLPQRKKRRVEPRAVLQRPRGHPILKGSRQAARDKLMALG
ncbi:MAG: IS4 family transposase [Blastocatellia bacterium]|nr:IS4 family transposase [Blastocatellia bacterium]